jgi:hypothetical protein
MTMRRMAAVLLAVAVVAGLSIGAGRRAQRFLADLPIVDRLQGPEVAGDGRGVARVGDQADVSVRPDEDQGI